jgi:hypothetical protein
VASCKFDFANPDACLKPNPGRTAAPGKPVSLHAFTLSEFAAARDVVADTPTITLWVESRARVSGKPILFSPTDRWGLRALVLQSRHAGALRPHI